MEKRFELFHRVIETLAQNHILDNLILIGSWCQYIYKIYFENSPHIPAVRTMDIDLLVPRPLKINKKIDADSILVQMGFEKQFSHPTGNVKYVHPELEIDFLTPQSGKGSDKPFKIKPLNIYAQRLRLLNILQQYIIQVKVDNFSVNVPEPAAFVIHKLLIYTRRTDLAKKEKDVFTAVEIGEYLLTLPEETEKIITIFNQLPKKQKRLILKTLEENSRQLFEFLNENMES